MGSVNEARYTFWHTIVDLAQDSGMPKAEWCRKNCISIKTFNHYEGIFRRQEERKNSYCKEEEEADQRTETSEAGAETSIEYIGIP